MEKTPNQPDPKKKKLTREEKDFENIMKEEMGVLVKKPPNKIEKVCHKFFYAMGIIESKNQTNGVINLDESVQNMEYTYRLDREGNLEKIPIETAREALQIGVEQTEKYLPMLSEKEREEAKDLLLRAKIYLAG